MIADHLDLGRIRNHGIRIQEAIAEWFGAVPAPTSLLLAVTRQWETPRRGNLTPSLFLDSTNNSDDSCMLSSSILRPAQQTIRAALSPVTRPTKAAQATFSPFHRRLNTSPVKPTTKKHLPRTRMASRPAQASDAPINREAVEQLLKKRFFYAPAFEIYSGESASFSDGVVSGTAGGLIPVSTWGTTHHEKVHPVSTITVHRVRLYKPTSSTSGENTSSSKKRCSRSTPSS